MSVLGASIADGLGKSKNVSGLGLGVGWVVVAFGVLIAAMVAFLAITGADVQPSSRAEADRADRATDR